MSAMKKTGPTVPMLILFAGLMLILTSCATTINSTEGTTDTLGNTTEATSDFTSSTSPGGDDTSQVEKTRAFAKENLDRLREDMARGSGEHLASLAHLLGIRNEYRNDFFALAKEKYPELFPGDSTKPDDLLAGLDAELISHPQWLQ
jgi:hypothetical protein